MIIFLYGEDTYRSRQKLKEIKDKFKKEIDLVGDSIVRIDGAESSLDIINSAVASSSLFSQKRLIIIENIFQNKSKTFVSETQKYFQNRKNDDNIIVFWDESKAGGLKTNGFFKFLLKQKIIQEFNALNNTELLAWIKKESEKNKATIELKAANHLAGLFGPDLWTISSEIKKIIHFKQAKQAELIKGKGELKIVLADIEKMSRGHVDENIFALTDAISQKIKPLALELLEREYEAGVAEGYLLHMLERQFKILLGVRQALDSGLTQRKIVSELKLHPFVAQKSVGQVRNFSLLFLKRIFSHLVKIEKKIKTGQSDLKTEVGILIAKI